MQIIKSARSRPKPSSKRTSASTNHLYKVGDRVVYHAVEYGNPDLDGKAGTIIFVDNTSVPYTVLFEDWCDPINGIHDLRADRDGRKYKPFAQWFSTEVNLTKVEEGGAV